MDELDPEFADLFRRLADKWLNIAFDAEILPMTEAPNDLTIRQIVRHIDGLGIMPRPAVTPKYAHDILKWRLLELDGMPD